MKTASSQTSTRLVGKIVLERYRIEELIGIGPFASVYRASDQELGGALVALKFFHPQLLRSQEVRAKLQASVLESRQLAHTSIVKTYDLEEAENTQLFLVSEFIEGWSLAKLLENQTNKALRPEAVLRILSSIATSLSYAHSKGVLHLNLKPENVLINNEGEIKVSDFSLSSSFDEADGFTLTGDAVANPAYMAPEQFSLEQISSATDIYSWSAIAMRLFTPQASAHTPNYLQHARNHLSGELHAMFSTMLLPDGMQEILSKSSALKPLERYQDGEQLAKAISLVYTPEKNPAMQRHISPRSRIKTRKNWLLQMLVIFALLITASITALWQEAPRRTLLANLFRAEKLFGTEFTSIKRVLGVDYSLNDPAELLEVAEHNTFVFRAMYDAGIDEELRVANGNPFYLVLAKQFPFHLISKLPEIKNKNMRDRGGNTLLHLISSQKRPSHVLAALQAGIDPHILNGVGLSPLHVSIIAADTKSINVFHLFGVSFVQRTFDGRTPLMLALQHFSVESKLMEVLEILLASGAQVKGYDNEGQNVLDYAKRAAIPAAEQLLLEHWKIQTGSYPEHVEGGERNK